ncbi:hypothetical protein GCM10027342_34590 [Photobacterium alginatilyticum]
MLRYRVAGVAADIADGNAVLVAVVQIDIIGAGGRNGDHLQARKLAQCVGIKHDFIADGNGGLLQAAEDLLRCRCRVLVPFVAKIRLRQLDVGGDGVPIEKDYVFHRLAAGSKVV